MLTPITHHSENTATLVAQASAPGHAAVAIIRLSGPQAWPITEALFEGQPLQHRYASYGWIRDPASGEALDQVLVLPFKAPHSFTGEPVVEIHCHGGPVLVRRILELCCQQGALLASRGDFTRRAFLNGKFSLTQAESIADLIHAEGEALAKLAAHNLRANSLNQQLETLRKAITAIQADIVASVDYPDEVEEPDRALLLGQCEALVQQAQSILEASHHNRLARQGFKVALLGLPNAGKSSLFNALLSLDRSIVTDQAGTTRDVVTETLTLDGVVLTLTDTAGLRESSDKVEQLGVARSWQSLHDADAVLYLVDSLQLATLADGQFPEADTAILREVPKTLPALLLATKQDLLPMTLNRSDVQLISVQSGYGLKEVFSWLQHIVRDSSQIADKNALQLSLNERQQTCLDAMVSHVRAAQQTLQEPNLPLDVVTVPLTDALLELDTLQGRDTREEVLDEVFSRFCVGK